MRDALDSFLVSPFFDSVGELTRLPLESQVLQKREGYRDLLRAWLMLDAAAQLDWPGRNDAYDGTNRDVATLYEFWLYFVLARAFRNRLGMEPMEDPLERVDGALPYCCDAGDRLIVNLKRGEASFCRFRWAGRNGSLRVHFFYNRSFSPSAVNIRGTYSKGFRPDFSLVLLPDEYDSDNWARAETDAEADGRIAYLHFDAKYRVENLAGIFGDQSLESEEARLESKASGTFKNADLYKMHTYNEAIRRSVGSYVLYPGDDPRNESGANRFERYREIVPGIGAFALKPEQGGGVESKGLDFVLGFVSDILEHQASRLTQSYRINYWTEDTIRETSGQDEIGSLEFSFDAKPPKDAQVLLGFVRDDDDARSCRETATFYCHAIEYQNSVDGEPGQPTDLDFDPFRSDLLVVYHQGLSAPWIAAVREVSLISAEDRAVELGRAPSEMGAAYYYRFQLADFEDALIRDVRPLVRRRPGRPVACRLVDFAECQVRS